MQGTTFALVACERSFLAGSANRSEIWPGWTPGGSDGSDGSDATTVSTIFKAATYENPRCMSLFTWEIIMAVRLDVLGPAPRS